MCKVKIWHCHPSRTLKWTKIGHLVTKWATPGHKKKPDQWKVWFGLFALFWPGEEKHRLIVMILTWLFSTCMSSLLAGAWWWWRFVSCTPQSLPPSLKTQFSLPANLVRFPNPLAFWSGLGERTRKKVTFQLWRPVVWKKYIVGPKLGTYLESAVHELSKNHPEK